MPPVGIPFDNDRGQRIESLRLARAHRFPSQKALAEACGVSTRTMSRWVRGDPIEDPNLRVLATELGVSTHLIVTGEEDQPATIPPLLTGAEQVLLGGFSGVGERLEAVETAVAALAASVEQAVGVLALLAEAGAARPPTTRRASEEGSDASANRPGAG